MWRNKGLLFQLKAVGCHFLSAFFFAVFNAVYCSKPVLAIIYHSIIPLFGMIII